MKERREENNKFEKTKREVEEKKSLNRRGERREKLNGK